ncbi:MAG: hypothetical protein WCD39_09305, partial [Methyloceanibacter sp.]
MSSILRMLSNRSAAIAQSFGARAETYDEHADLQRGVARRLARLLPQLAAPRVLELGCGTEPFASPGALNVGRLDEGLGWLMDWDETETKAALACPT